MKKNYPHVTFQKEGHLYTLHKSEIESKIIPSVTQIIQENNLGFDFSALPDIDLAWFGDRGTKVHRACEYLDQGRLDWDTVAGEIFGYIESYQAGKDFYKFHILETELLVFDRLERYAGTLDRIVRFEDLSTIAQGVAQVDIKAGVPHWSHGVQTAGYNICLDGDWIEQTRHIPRFCIYLDRNGGLPEMRAYPEINDFVIFESALNLTYARKRVA